MNNIPNNTAEVGYNVTKGTEYFEFLWTSVVPASSVCRIMVNSREVIGTTEYVTL